MKKVVKVSLIIFVVVLIGIGSYFGYKFIIDSMQKQEEMDKDENPPILKLNDIELTKGKSYNVYSFVDTCEDDISKNCEVEFESEEMGNYKEIGTYEIKIKASDAKENFVVETASLKIVEEKSIVSEEKPVPSESTTTDTPSIPPKKEENPIVTTTSDTNETRQEYYGTVVRTITTTTYNIYQDGTKVVQDTKTETKYDYSGYTGDLEKMSVEAIQNIYDYSGVMLGAYNILNEYRKEHNLPELNNDVNLISAATLRAMELGYSNKFSNVRPDGTDVFSVVQQTESKANYLYEHIAKNYTDFEKLYQANKSSLTPYLNESTYKNVGVGIAKVFDTYYWVILLSD